MRKTAMQQLKDAINDDRCINIKEVLSEIEELLETEKNDIIEAYDSGFVNGICVCPSLDEGKDYYPNTFQK